MNAFDRLQTANADDATALWIEIDRADAVLEAETKRKIAAYEQLRRSGPA